MKATLTLTLLLITLRAQAEQPPFTPPAPETIAALLEFSGPVSLTRSITTPEELARSPKDYGMPLASFSYADPEHTSERITVTLFAANAFLGEKRSELIDRLSKPWPKSPTGGPTFGISRASDDRPIFQFPMGFGPGGGGFGALLPCRDSRFELVVVQSATFHDDEDSKKYSHHVSPKKELRSTIEAIEALVLP